MTDIMRRLGEVPGKISYACIPLSGGVASYYNAGEPLIAASIIKIPIMIEAFRQARDGEIDFNEKHLLSENEKMPSCGALNLLHEGLEVTVLDLIRLMICLSDNTATNILIDRLGAEKVNRTMSGLGCGGIILRRKLFDREAAARGIQNMINAREIAQLLKMMYDGTLVSPEASKEMIDILSEQRLNGKIPFYLEEKGIRVAHKTGEDDGITHDAGIVFTKRPFILCMFSNETDVPLFERLMQDAAKRLCELYS